MKAHYFSPMAGLVVLLVTIGLRQAADLKLKNVWVGRNIVIFLIVLQLALNITLTPVQPKPAVRVKRDLTDLKLVDFKMTARASQTEITQRFCSDQSLANTVALYSIAWVTPDGLTQVKNSTLPVKLNWMKTQD
jgi:4-amino-4-deoxy-L-arabinose transferase-like glycosyltransferase